MDMGQALFKKIVAAALLVEVPVRAVMEASAILQTQTCNKRMRSSLLNHLRRRFQTVFHCLLQCRLAVHYRVAEIK